MSSDLLSLGSSVLAAMCSLDGRSQGIESSRSSDGVRVVVPQGALDHVARWSKFGEEHRIVPVARNLGPHFILDLPGPQEYDARPYRCITCHHSQGNIESLCTLGDLATNGPEESGEDVPLGSYASSDGKYWSVTDADIRRKFPQALVCKAPKQAAVWMTPLVLMELCQAFYGALNVRQVRRHLAALYSSNALAHQTRMHVANLQPYSFAWQMQALPTNHALHAVILRGFSSFIRARVSTMSR